VYFVEEKPMKATRKPRLRIKGGVRRLQERTKANILYQPRFYNETALLENTCEGLAGEDYRTQRHSHFR